MTKSTHYNRTFLEGACPKDLLKKSFIQFMRARSCQIAVRQRRVPGEQSSGDQSCQENVCDSDRGSCDGLPTARMGFSISSKTTLWPKKAERGERGEPVKPFRRISGERKHSLLWANEHIEALGSIFNTCNDARTCSQLGRLEQPLWRRGTPINEWYRGLRGRRGSCVLWEKSFQRTQTTFIPLRTLTKQF